MNIVSHIVYPVVFAQSANCYRAHNRQTPIFNWKQLLLIGLSGGLSDILSPHTDFNARYNSLTHSIWFLLAALLIAFALAWKFQRFRTLIYSCLFAIFFHLFCDMISGGLGLFVPLSSRIFGSNYILTRYWVPFDITAILFLSVSLIYNLLPARARSLALIAGLALAICGSGLAFSGLDTETFFLKKIPVLKIDSVQLQDAQRVVDTLFEKWQSGDFELLSNEFSEDNRKALTPEWQEASFKSIRSAYGDYRGVTFVEAITARFYFPRNILYRFKGSFSQMPLQPEIDIGFDSKGKVSHFIFWNREYSSRLMNY
jgi:membrane-bound metal-dependent hydrolase YbcI (DUF457 family)